MAAVSETIVREYFELHGFYVRQQRKYVTPSRLEDDEIDFFVINPRGVGGTPLPFVLGSADLAGVARAIVVVKGWHTETFSSSVLANAPEIFRFLDPAAFRLATQSFGGEGPLTKLLVVPALPAANEARQQSIDMLRGKGLDGVIPFRTMLPGSHRPDRGQPQLSEVRPPANHPHPQELRLLPRAAARAVQVRAKKQTPRPAIAACSSDGPRLRFEGSCRLNSCDENRRGRLKVASSRCPARRRAGPWWPRFRPPCSRCGRWRP